MTLEHEKLLESSYPSFSILIEWENLRFAELEIAKRMLQNVAKQINDISDNISVPPEILILYNEDVMQDDKIEPFVRENLEPCISLIDLKIIHTPDLTYYNQRNYGAKKSSNEILIMLDCDVIPDVGWLINLLQPFDDSNVFAVGGVPYMTQDDIYGKAMSLFWIFPPKDEPDFRTAELPEFVPDNAAFRREFLIEHPFPESTSFRGDLSDLCNLLKDKGFKIFRQPKANVAHPPPVGLRNIAIRSLADGHDKYLAWRGSHQRFLNKKVKKHSIVSYIKQKLANYRERRIYVHLNFKEKGGVFFVGSIWFGSLLTGFLLTAIDPRLITKKIRI